jgi:hypothetical protein
MVLKNPRIYPKNPRMVQGWSKDGPRIEGILGEKLLSIINKRKEDKFKFISYVSSKDDPWDPRTQGYYITYFQKQKKSSFFQTQSLISLTTYIDMIN